MEDSLGRLVRAVAAAVVRHEAVCRSLCSRKITRSEPQQSGPDRIRVRDIHRVHEHMLAAPVHTGT